MSWWHLVVRSEFYCPKTFLFPNGPQGNWNLLLNKLPVDTRIWSVFRPDNRWFNNISYSKHLIQNYIQNTDHYLITEVVQMELSNPWPNIMPNWLNFRTVLLSGQLQNYFCYYLIIYFYFTSNQILLMRKIMPFNVELQLKLVVFLGTSILF